MLKLLSTTLRRPSFRSQTFFRFSTSPYVKDMASMDDWQAAIENTNRPVLIQASATWCNPCKILKPMMVQAVEKHNGKIDYLYMDVEKFESVAQFLGIKSLP